MSSVRPGLWEELGVAGLKVLLALYENGGEANFITVAYTAHIGRETWYVVRDKLAKYGLAEVVEEGQRRWLRLTERGRRVAEYLKAIEDLIQGV